MLHNFYCCRRGKVHISSGISIKFHEQ